MTLKDINFRSLAFAGFVAGYIMYFADKYLSGTSGLFGSYPGTAWSWWMLQHHIEAIVFAIPFALPTIQRRLPGSGWLKGTVSGFTLGALYNPPAELRSVEEQIYRFEEKEQAVPVHHEQWRPSRHIGSRRKQWHSR